MSRFILTLLAITHHDGSSAQSSQQQTLQFATTVERIASQLGASLSDSRRADGGVTEDGETKDEAIREVELELKS